MHSLHVNAGSRCIYLALVAGVCVALTDMLDVPGTVEEVGQAEERSSVLSTALLASQRLQEISGPPLTLAQTLLLLQ